MTVSTHESAAGAQSSRRATIFATLGLLLCACRPGLPPEPAGQDPADDGAHAPKYQPRPNPYETSAFDGVDLDAAGGHEGMNHDGMNHGTGSTPKPEAVEPPVHDPGHAEPKQVQQ